VLSLPTDLDRMVFYYELQFSSGLGFDTVECRSVVLFVEL
jgi:hypothetical protein